MNKKVKARSIESVIFKHSIYISLDHNGRINQLGNEFDLDIHHDPKGDGNCQFDAVSDQLQTLGVFRSHDTLRQEVVHYLENHPYLGNSHTQWYSFLTEQRINYLSRMSEDGTYWDQVTLQAVAEMCNLQILILSTLNGGTTLIRPDGTNVFSPTMPYIILGHFAEGHEDHYVSLTHDHNQIRNIVANSIQVVYSGDVKDGNELEESENEAGIDIDDEGVSCINDSDNEVNSEFVNCGSDNDDMIPDECRSDRGMISDQNDESSTCELDEDVINDTYGESVSVNVVEEELIAMPDTSLGENNDVVTEENVCANGSNKQVIDKIDDNIMDDDLKDEVVSDQDSMSAFDKLPFEMVVKIIEHAITMDVVSRQFLRCVNWQFNAAVNEAAQSVQEPDIYINPFIQEILKSPEECVISVNKLIRCAGKSSGLALKLRSYFCGSTWYFAWLILRRVGAMRPGWFVITRVFWKRPSKK